MTSPHNGGIPIMAYQATTNAYEQQLSKEVPTHLFRFEEKVFGLTIPQLLIDSLSASGIWYLWSTPPLPVAVRIILCILAACTVILVVHVGIKHRPLTEWAGIALFYWLTPPKTIWYNPAIKVAQLKGQQKPQQPSVQKIWIRLDGIHNGYMSFRSGSLEQSKGKKDSKTQPARYSAVLEVTGVNFQLLSEQDQARMFQAYETFLAGLEFPLQIISRNETIDIQTYEPLMQQQEQLAALSNRPRLEAMAQSHLHFLRRSLGTCVVTHHFVVVSITPLEEILRKTDGKKRSRMFSIFGAFFGGKKEQEIASEQVVQQLRVRLKIVRDGFKDIGLQVRLLNGNELAQFYADCLSPGLVQKRGEHCMEMLTPVVTQKEVVSLEEAV